MRPSERLHGLQSGLPLCIAAASLLCVAGCDATISARLGHAVRRVAPSYGDGGVPLSREVCGNGIDDDGNGQIDEGCSCEAMTERSCYGGPPGTDNVGICHDGMQACSDMGEFSSWGACTGWVGPTHEIAENGLDDNCDGRVDEPGGICVPTGHNEFGEQCSDGRDNDCDTLHDCADPDCRGVAGCPATCAPTEGTCWGHVDEDCDGLVDCADPDCAMALACQPSPCPDGSTPTYRPRALSDGSGASSISSGDGAAVEPMTCEGGTCDPGLVAVYSPDGSFVCIPPPPPCTAGTSPTYQGSGTWTCDPPCAYIVHYGAIYGGQTVCAGPPPSCDGGLTPTFVFEAGTWECQPMCDGGLYDPHVLDSGVLVCVPC